VTGTLANGATFHYWTFNGKVPDPFIRVRVGDIVTVRLKNDAASMMMHNIDLHAVMDPGGGAQATVADPGETKTFTSRRRRPASSFITARPCLTPSISPTACTA
jgi:nitrite reductase (NO-forming)